MIGKTIKEAAERLRNEQGWQVKTAKAKTASVRRRSGRDGATSVRAPSTPPFSSHREVAVRRIHEASLLGSSPEKSSSNRTQPQEQAVMVEADDSPGGDNNFFDAVSKRFSASLGTMLQTTTGTESTPPFLRAGKSDEKNFVHL